MRKLNLFNFIVIITNHFFSEHFECSVKCAYFDCRCKLLYIILNTLMQEHAQRFHFSYNNDGHTKSCRQSLLFNNCVIFAVLSYYLFITHPIDINYRPLGFMQCTRQLLYMLPDVRYQKPQKVVNVKYRYFNVTRLSEISTFEISPRQIILPIGRIIRISSFQPHVYCTALQ